MYSTIINHFTHVARREMLYVLFGQWIIDLAYNAVDSPKAQNCLGNHCLYNWPLPCINKAFSARQIARFNTFKWGCDHVIRSTSFNSETRCKISVVACKSWWAVYQRQPGRCALMVRTRMLVYRIRMNKIHPTLGETRHSETHLPIGEGKWHTLNVTQSFGFGKSAIQRAMSRYSYR